ncbi:DOT1-domain-containing protein [Tilletiopsis washingtonensis]|uniref:Histone-lysine N-methyltransferase, H3 lysine-79 specific n=1 Tax=Tilletiopsis washingtonensis TaxID=58919 RepID=A0A316ZI58_9BASI|nr:DOT1-domain-containing protein [Tilletiopsis washingtonensis]PWN99953.1 DOT1-domain-containing protein [Tilletiopsis washingtonensis]
MTDLHPRPGAARPAAAARPPRPPPAPLVIARRAAPAPSSSAHRTSASSSSARPAGSSTQARNALPEERRRRIDAEVREREERRRDEAARAARAAQASARAARPASRPKSSASAASAGGAAKAKASPRKKRASASDSLSPARAASSSSRSTPTPASTSGYRKLGRTGVESEYNVPRALAAPGLDGKVDVEREEGTIESVALGEGKRYGALGAALMAGSKQTSKISAQPPPPHSSIPPAHPKLPRDIDEYDPLGDLLRVVRAVVSAFLPREYAVKHFGNLEELEFGSAAGAILSAAAQTSTPMGNGSQTPISSTSTSTPTPSSPRGSVPQLNDSSPSKDSPAPSASQDRSSEQDSILRSFTKARNRRDGPLFLRTLERYNVALSAARREGVVAQAAQAMEQRGLPDYVWETVGEQCYSRTVGPYVEELGKYQAFSDNVYGELLPRFMSEISQLTSLGPSSVFVDLGSGVSNLVLQVALQTGAQSYGVEMMGPASALGERQVEEAKRRWKMWGVLGGEAQSWKGDFTACERTREALSKADLVLVNNYAFTAPTNERLSLLFLDLKDGAQIVSLKPFVPPDFRLTQRTLDSPLAILSVVQRSYGSGCVSWADGGGRYYIHVSSPSAHASLTLLSQRDAPDADTLDGQTVDRSMVSRFLDSQGSTKTFGAKRWQKRARVADSDEEDDE